jgi:hypothetical protein
MGMAASKDRRSLLHKIARGLGHAVHLQAAQHEDHCGAGGIMTHDEPPAQ